MDPVIALLLCSSPFAGPPMSYESPTAATISRAISVESAAQEALARANILRVADTPGTTNVGQWQGFIAEAAQRFGIPEAWIRAVMRAESDGQATIDGRPITSPAGAVGLMQVLPKTYAEMQRRHGLGPDPADPRDNILAGTAYLREMLDRFGYPHLFAAYNAGPERFEAYRRGVQPLPAETHAYVAQIGAELANGSDNGPAAKQLSSVPAAPERRRNLNPLLFFVPGRPSTLFVNHDDSASRADQPGAKLPLEPETNRRPGAPTAGSKSAAPMDDQGPP
ncbi:Transglycosylase SLT domain-containing protein [Enhydrobacter aerosaccus]|uniref:Transglycosylase SLT domain-containing protein n=1 Tax=Enhydrobacter aerosaccus TaxID=225324 RepID=A0A1T4S8R4_9HYPH|nr:lytic transglycosylase domain-containing protein [Enhydrobacter aerosaccus]SKA24633.1 Transglycosylase SLT domain-containing protein [Enhydrobacter aerosaccus]